MIANIERVRYAFALLSQRHVLDAVPVDSYEKAGTNFCSETVQKPNDTVTSQTYEGQRKQGCNTLYTIVTEDSGWRRSRVLSLT